MIQLYPPIFINIEFSKSFIQEYPICSQQKNIVVPYPTTDPALFSGEFPSLLNESSSTFQQLNANRDKLIFYYGGRHGECEILRALLNQLMNNNPKWAMPRGDKKRELGFLSSKFCPVPIGDSPSSKRMYDIMHVS